MKLRQRSGKVFHREVNALKCWMLAYVRARESALNVLKYCLPSIALIYLFVEWFKCWCVVLHVLFCECDKEQPCQINWPPDIYRTCYVCSRCMQPTRAHHRNNVNFDSFVYETGAHHICLYIPFASVVSS